MPRKKLHNRNIRSLVKTSDRKTYSISLPIEAIRKFRWQTRQKLSLTIDPKKSA